MDFAGSVCFNLRAPLRRLIFYKDIWLKGEVFFSSGASKFTGAAGRGVRMEKDELLVAMAQKGDLTAYEALVQRYQHRVFNLASKMVNNREDALDIAQEIFMQIYLALPGFRGESVFSTWVYRVASNKCLDYLRKKRLKKRRPLHLSRKT